MMIVLLLLLSQFFTAAATLDVSSFMRKCTEQSGVHKISCNRTAFETIFTEEAKKIDRIPEKHFGYCAGGEAPQFQLGENDQVLVQMEIMKNFEKKRFENVDEVMPYIRQRYPTTHSVIMKLKEFLDEAMKSSNFNDEATKYVHYIGSHVVESVVSFSQSANPGLTKEKVMHMVVKEATSMFAKVKANYDTLSESSKKDIEVLLCMRTYYRLFEEMGLFKIIKAIEMN